MEPLDGVVAIGFFSNRFEADIAVAKLDESGIRASVLGDPAATIAPHIVTSRGFEVAVAAQLEDEAKAVLDHVEDNALPMEAPGYPRRTSRQRVVGWLLMAAFFGAPLVYAIGGVLDWLF